MHATSGTVSLGSPDSGGPAELIEVTRPAGGMGFPLIRRKEMMHEAHPRAPTVRRELHFHDARFGGQNGRAVESPADDQSAGRVHLEEAAPDGGAAHIDCKATSNRRVKGRPLAHPTLEQFGPGEVFEDLSGSASTNTWAVISAAMTPAGLDCGFEALEAIGPEARQERLHLGESLGSGLVEPSLAVGTDIDKACALEHVQVVGNRLLGDVEVGSDLVD